jgi:NADPH:quinone reductase-like Zn-dependent oxidoreductase
MKAIAQDRYGDTDVLRLQDIDRPAPGEGEVLVQVKAAGADPGVWHLMTGVPYLMRVIGFGFRRPKVPVRGLALAGVVQSAGPGVTRFRQGDEVFGTCRSGSFAVTPVIDRTYPLADAAAAIRQIAGGHATGKGVVIV